MGEGVCANLRGCLRENPEILSAMAEPSEVIDPATAEPASEGEFVSYPDSPFQLFQPYPPAGDQPADISLYSAES